MVYAMITLKEITAENWHACTRLKTKPEQAHYVAGNAFSLAQSKYEPWCVPLAVYAGEEMVGFVMYTLDPQLNTYGILRMMIDAAHQGKGYAKEALRQVIEIITADNTHDHILLTVLPENEGARQLYAGFGFRETGEMWGDTLVMRYDY